MRSVQSLGIVLFNRDYREDDKLVKMFTETEGKRMFFVKHAGKSKAAALVQPLTRADFILKINDKGLSYIDDTGEVETYPKINSDIFKLSYASYLLALVDAALPDGEPDPALFVFLRKTLDLMESGLDYDILTNIFEIQLLDRFGIHLNFHECSVCHRVGLAFDFSHQFLGVLCPEHYHLDKRRHHLNPNVLYLLDQFHLMSIDHLTAINLNPSIKKQLRAFIDELYEDYVGLRLKSKTFIDQLDSWADIMRPSAEIKDPASDLERKS
ncbi:DNA repair protein RecO [Streptococcus halichoeri]|uniref:DNA repair protein RecO n=1 Tax=Streptococcus halichoeri TaxID=254785 RepID=UPI001357247B|nr:DNA repair protein RecO [Streptococcus halichoeri]